MNKGYDGPPDSHLIHREPLRADDLDWEVINAMGGFTFGQPEQILDRLRTVLTSDSYLAAVAAWDTKREKRRPVVGAGTSSSSMTLSDASVSPKKKRFSGFDFKRKLFKEEKKPEEPIVKEKEPADPTRGFDPLISIYFLAREKMERERVYGRGHFASSQTSLEAPVRAAGSAWRYLISRSRRRRTRWVKSLRRRARTAPATRARRRRAEWRHAAPAADAEQSNIADLRMPRLERTPGNQACRQPHYDAATLASAERDGERR